MGGGYVSFSNKEPVRVIDAKAGKSYNTNDEDFVIIVNGNQVSGVKINIPAASLANKGRIIKIKNNVIFRTITLSNSFTNNGVDERNYITSGSYVEIISDGNKWYKIN